MWWTGGYVAEHAVSMRVEPLTAIAFSTNGNPAILVTLSPHGLVAGDTVIIANHDTTPPLNGERVVETVLTPSSFTVDVNGGGQPGTGGTVRRTIPVEPLTLEQGKLRAGLDWTSPDPRDALMQSFISSARQHVERRTELALLAQTRDVYFDAIASWVIDLPSLCKPLQSVVTVQWFDTAGGAHVLDPASYLVDTVSGRIGLTSAVTWPSGLRTFQAWNIRVIAGAPSIAEIPAPLLQAVGLLVGHLATLGRDLAVATTSSVLEVPQGFEDTIAPWVPVTLP